MTCAAWVRARLRLATGSCSRTARRSCPVGRGGRPGDGPAAVAAREPRRWCVAASAFGIVLLALVPMTDSTARQRIGRLFSTPEQRLELDRMRSDTGVAEEAMPVAGRTAPESPPGHARGLPAFPVTVDGIVLRSDGHRMAWVNGVEAVLGGATRAEIGIEGESAPNGSLRIRLSAGRKRVVLRSGETIDVDGRVRDAYERRSAGAAETRGGGRTPDGGDDNVGTSAVSRSESPESVTAPLAPESIVPALARSVRAVPVPLRRTGIRDDR